MTDAPAAPGRSYPPVRVDGVLEPSLSRGLWLVKWLLLVPHYVVLAFLWAAFVVLTVVAFLAILVTGRYPRALFDFNVGVLRWSWRVHYYGYAALGTDRYPPFTLADVPDYPAHLEIEYPERLSRGLVLVKTWLLAIPHYLVLAVFVGGGIWFGVNHRWNGGWNGTWAEGGLVGLLVLISAVVLLFTGRYPGSLYDFVLGMDRWAVRVAAYAALMTDRYPPFRLDTGGPDPGGVPAGPRPVPGAPVRGAPAGWTAGRVVSVVIGAVLLLISTGLLAGGGWLLWADRTQRVDGFLQTPVSHVSTSGYAITSDGIRIEGSGADWVLDRVVGTARLEARPAAGERLFVGIAPTSAVNRYLGGVQYVRMGSLGGGTGPGTMTRVAGGPPAVPPQQALIWAAQSSGAGPQVVSWHPTVGTWTAVVMRTDARAGVTADLRASATVPAAPWIATGLLATGVVFLAAGGLLVGVAAARAGRRTAVPEGPPAPPPVPRTPVEGDRTRSETTGG